MALMRSNGGGLDLAEIEMRDHTSPIRREPYSHHNEANMQVFPEKRAAACKLGNLKCRSMMNRPKQWRKLLGGITH